MLRKFISGSTIQTARSLEDFPRSRNGVAPRGPTKVDGGD